MWQLRDVGKFVEQHGSFNFNVVQYLQSLQHVDHLISRADIFQRYQAGLIEAPLTKGFILNELQSSLVKTIPGYRRYHSALRFEDLPLISKKDLQLEGHPFVRRTTDDESMLGNLWHTTTFGTTAAPVSIFYSPAFYFEYLHLTIWKLANRFLTGCDDHSVFAFCLDDNPNRSEFVTIDPSGITGATIRVSVNPMCSQSFLRAFSLLEQVQPAIIATRPSLFEAIVAYAKIENLSLDAEIRCVFSAGSFLTEETRREVEHLFCAPVLNCYGLAEFGYSAGECDRRCGYHIDETSVLIELLDTDGLPTPDGSEGQVVISSVVNDAMPLIRFCTGDFAVIERSKCSCGSLRPRLLSIKGHGPFHFRFSNGELLHPARFYPLAWLYPLRDFQVIEETTDTFQINIDPDEIAPSDIAYQTTEYVKRIMPPGSKVHVSVCDLQSVTNFKRFLSNKADTGTLLGRD